MQTQDTAISFSFTVEEMNIIREGLGLMPHDEAHPIIEKIYWTVFDTVFDEDESSPDMEDKKDFDPSKYPFGVKKDGTPKKRPGRKTA